MTIEFVRNEIASLLNYFIVVIIMCHPRTYIKTISRGFNEDGRWQSGRREGKEGLEELDGEREREREREGEEEGNGAVGGRQRGRDVGQKEKEWKWGSERERPIRSESKLTHTAQHCC